MAEPRLTDDGNQHGDDEQSCQIHAPDYRGALDRPCRSDLHPLVLHAAHAAGSAAVHVAGPLAMARGEHRTRNVAIEFRPHRYARVEATAQTLPHCPIHTREGQRRIRWRAAVPARQHHRMRARRIRGAVCAATGRRHRDAGRIAAGCRLRGYRDRLPDISLAATGTQQITGRLACCRWPGIAAGRQRAGSRRTLAAPDQLSPRTRTARRGAGAPLLDPVLLLDADSGPGLSSPLAGRRASRRSATYGYAVQWWAFAALGTGSVTLRLNLKRIR